MDTGGRGVSSPVSVFLIAALLAGQDPAPKTGGPFAVDLARPSTTYWCWVPSEYQPDRTWPLMVLLHGAGDTAENFIRFWSAGAAKGKFILAACKSRDQGWAEADGDIVLAAVEDVKKKYAVDPERIVLLGYSSGAHMSTMWGFKRLSTWRAVCLLAGGFSPPGGKEYKAAIGKTSILVCCGERDPNLAGCKEVFDRVKKDGFDAASNWVPGMEHSPPKPEAYQWFWDQLEARLNSGAERLKRGKRALAAKRWVEAVEEFLAAKAETVDAKSAKAAEAEIAKLEKAGAEKLTSARKLLDKGDKTAAKKLLEDVARYAGLECASKAMAMLRELE